MRLAICGHGRHGKGSVSQWFAEHTALRYHQSTSEAAALMVWRTMNTFGRPRYHTWKECWEDRHNHRDRWAQIIWRHNQPDGTTLYEEMLARNDVLDGIRRQSELAACLARGIVDAAVWVDACQRLPVEPGTSNEVTAADCGFFIDNNGPWRNTESALRDLCDSLALPIRGSR